MPDLSTTYLGLQLKNPLVASASPLARKVDLVKKMEAAGVAAVVMDSLFEEQVTHESLELDFYLNRGTDFYAEALTYFPDMTFGDLGARGYIKHLSEVKQAVSIPVIGSLNGVTPGGWVQYAEQIEGAGADALELNMYYLATDPTVSSANLEDRYVELVAEVKQRIKIPLALKLSPFFTSLPQIARRFVEAGADGLILFNRFYQPDLDLETMDVTPNLVLSNSSELRLPLRWIAILYGRVQADFALSSGVHTSQDAIKAILAGANVAMTTSELLAHGIDRATAILSEMESWMVEREYQTVTDMRGCMSQQSVANPAAFERANYIRALRAYQVSVT
ncbi:MAG: dihydroorotate dehydrogenase-like protein [Chloroflexota bacterium]